MLQPEARVLRSDITLGRAEKSSLAVSIYVAKLLDKLTTQTRGPKLPRRITKSPQREV